MKQTNNLGTIVYLFWAPFSFRHGLSAYRLLEGDAVSTPGIDFENLIPLTFDLIDFRPPQPLL